VLVTDLWTTPVGPPSGAEIRRWASAINKENGAPQHLTIQEPIAVTNLSTSEKLIKTIESDQFYTEATQDANSLLELGGDELTES
jgi:hypothetical protein